MSNGCHTTLLFETREENFERLENVEYIPLVIFFSSVKSVYFDQFFCFLYTQPLSDVGPYQTIC